MIPKPHQPGKWRLIVDLSHPRGSSVNDGIESELQPLKYTSVDKAVQMILEMGAGTKLAKFDVEGAYRLVPVHPDGQWEEALRLHPDAEFVKYLLRGITQGFRIGFDYRPCKCRQAVANMTCH